MIRRPPRSPLFPYPPLSRPRPKRQPVSEEEEAPAAKDPWSIGRAVAVKAGFSEFTEVAPEEVERSEEHTSELQSQSNLVCRLLLEKKKKHTRCHHSPGLSNT